MCKEDFIKRYGEDAYKEYLEKQKLLVKRWREKNLEKSRTYGKEYYWRTKDEKGRK
jgi:hypothetical protein